MKWGITRVSSSAGQPKNQVIATASRRCARNASKPSKCSLGLVKDGYRHMPYWKMKTYPNKMVSGCRMNRYLKRTAFGAFKYCSRVMMGKDPICEPRSFEL